ncbi:nicolin-1 isoform X2 [Oreochromis aureus]|uniref:nicolin-1 isoform X2 n=1 Tax=Oreochromis aureus TaxID=47969 RepID=UPI0012BBD6C1|nr:nicolin-1 isoform X2 [Oreochromis aureus]
MAEVEKTLPPVVLPDRAAVPLLTTGGLTAIVRSVNRCIPLGIKTTTAGSSLFSLSAVVASSQPAPRETHNKFMQVEPDHVVCVRLILRQPSLAWLTFSLEDIKIFPHTEPDPEKEVSDWLSDLTLIDQHPDLEGLPDPQTVSSSIQQMWALTEVMQTNQTTASIGRFDVDGCYDISLLSLT